jgi:DNA-binding transcriptional MocR family regulator
VSRPAGPAGYRQLSALLRDKIESGELVPGQPVPSLSTLAQTYGLSGLTVRRAVGVLRQEGLIDVRHGYRTRVRDLSGIEDVDLPPTRVWARMPTPAERERWDIPDGCPVLVTLDLLDGDGRAKVWPAHRYRLNPGAV